MNFSLDPDLADRLSGIDLEDSNAVWAKLTHAERQDFENIIKSGDVSTLIPVKEPWWTHKQKQPLIEEITNESSCSKSVPNDVPAIHKNITDFSKISTKAPAECVAHNLCNVLAAYTITHRFFNGEHLKNAQESCNYLIAVCANLKTNTNFADEQMSIDSVAHDCRTEGLTIDLEQTHGIGEDVRALLDGPTNKSNLYCLAALSDIHQLLITATKQNRNEKNAPTGEFTKRFFDHEIINFENVNKSKLNASAKKIEYYLAFVKKFR